MYIALLCTRLCTSNQPRRSPRLHHPHYKIPWNVGEATSSYCTITTVQLEKDKEELTNEIEGLRKQNKSLLQQ